MSSIESKVITACNVCSFARIGYCELEQYSGHGSASIYTMEEDDKVFRSDIPKECPAKQGLPFSIRFEPATYKATSQTNLAPHNI